MTVGRLPRETDSDDASRSGGGYRYEDVQSAHPLPVEAETGARDPHRHWHVFSLGADLVNHGLSGYDADAISGIWHLSAVALIALLTEANEEYDGGECVGKLLKRIVDRHRDDLSLMGAEAAWHCRWRGYHQDVARWKAQPDVVKTGRWRQRPMTLGQRALVQITAVQLGITLPEGLTRGTAADRLDQHGANLSYRQDI